MMRVVLVGLALAGIAAAPAWRTAPPPPLPESFELSRLAGTWYEVASYGAWAHRRCTRDTVFDYVVRSTREIEARRRCGVAQQVEVRGGRIRIERTGDPRWRARWGSNAVAWWPESWADHWVVALDPGYQWYVVGDDDHARLSVLSRRIGLDDAALAQAIAAARAQGYDVDRLRRVPQNPAAFSR